MIAIVKYGSGNIGAIANIYKQLKIPYVVSNDIAELAKADSYIIPGVGAFDPTMEQLKNSGLLELLNEEVLGNGKKVLGICVGMQILAEGSEEGRLSGLGWIPGKVRKIDATLLPPGPKLPHMGWNSINLSSSGNRIFTGIDSTRGFYFLHNYFFDASDSENVIATVNYGNDIPCAVVRSNIFGVQFHPEKSHSNGVNIFKNFAELS